LVKEIIAYWIISRSETNNDWCTRKVIRVISKGTLFAEYAHRGAMRVENETGVSKKRPDLAQNAPQDPR
jgi:hypothetical protein